MAAAVKLQICTSRSRPACRPVNRLSRRGWSSLTLTTLKATKLIMSEGASTSTLTATSPMQSDPVDGDLKATLPVEEQAEVHICFLAKHGASSYEVRLACSDSIAELKAVGTTSFSVSFRLEQLTGTFDIAFVFDKRRPCPKNEDSRFSQRQTSG